VAVTSTVVMLGDVQHLVGNLDAAAGLPSHALVVRAAKTSVRAAAAAATAATAAIGVVVAELGAATEQ